MDWLKAILSDTNERINSPWKGTLTFSWIVLNWDMVLYLILSEYPIEQRLHNIKMQYFNIWTWIILPPIFTSIYVYYAPWVELLIFNHNHGYKEKELEKKSTSLEFEVDVLRKRRNALSNEIDELESKKDILQNKLRNLEMDDYPIEKNEENYDKKSDFKREYNRLLYDNTITSIESTFKNILNSFVGSLNKEMSTIIESIKNLDSETDIETLYKLFERVYFLIDGIKRNDKLNEKNTINNELVQKVNNIIKNYNKFAKILELEKHNEIYAPSDWAIRAFRNTFK